MVETVRDNRKREDFNLGIGPWGFDTKEDSSSLIGL
jgi:hypothetical protein